jgi:hypothetical protein
MCVTLMEIEKALVKAFIIPVRRSRYLSMLEIRGGRDKWRRQLADFAHWDQRFLHPIEKGDTKRTCKLLRDADAPEQCYVLSEWDQLDGKEMKLGEALSACVGYGMGTVLSCVPGRLAFYEAEGPANASFYGGTNHEPIRPTAEIRSASPQARIAILEQPHQSTAILRCREMGHVWA